MDPYRNWLDAFCKNALQICCMKYLQILFLIIISWFGVSAQLVVQVYDGDTYKILNQGKLVVVRLANVDAPELNQFYGTTVKYGVSKLILGKIVMADFAGTDRYGRTIAHILVDGKSLDSLLIANGWAWNYLQYSKSKPELSVYESMAKTSRTGMWKCLYNVPPWIWRHLDKRYKRLYEMCR
jgi:endonuclease YncB( thermonuclease family)